MYEPTAATHMAGIMTTQATVPRNHCMACDAPTNDFHAHTLWHAMHTHGLSSVYAGFYYGTD